MANIRPRKNKDGIITSYQIRVFKGKDINGKQLEPYTTSFKPDPNRTDKQNAKALNEFAVEFEQKCKSGLIADDRQTFEKYAQYVINLKERSGVKHNTIVSYKSFLPRINASIGHLKLNEIRPQHLNSLYEQLGKAGERNRAERSTAKTDLKELIKKEKTTIKALSQKVGVANNTLSVVCNGGKILKDKAELIAKALNKPYKDLFNTSKDNTPLSNKTIIEYHRFISTVLAQADKEMIIMFNPAHKATPPKAEEKIANYFQIEDVERIRDSLEQEPLKWKTLVHLLLISGARRGEIAGLKWDVVDFKSNCIHICNNLLYSPDIGIFEDTTKTKKSNRFVDLPVETMELLKEYRKYYLSEMKKYGDQWHNTNYLFYQDKTGNVGKPLHPDTINGYLTSFSKRYNLPHINPHAFRHTMASILYFNHMDSISISHRLGHSKISTTTDIYSHIMQEADRQSADCIANAILRPKHIDISEERKAE